MSRNGSGSFTLSDTLSNGSTGDADEVNAILQDIATEITNSVAVDGQSTMTAPFKAANGTASLPSYTFGSDTNTGLYRVGSDAIGVAVNGTLLATFNSSGVTLASGAFVGNLTGTPSVTPIPSGTVMLFVQTSAPTGWTKSTTHNDKTLRVVSGTASSGGDTDFSSVFTSGRSVTGTVASHTLTVDEIPAHTHDFVGIEVLGAGANSRINATTTTGDRATTDSTGGGNGHSHGFTGDNMNFNVKYVDVIIATKD